MKKLKKVTINKASDDGWDISYANCGHKCHVAPTQLLSTLKKINAFDYDSAPRSARAKSFSDISNDIVQKNGGNVWAWASALQNLHNK